MALTQDAAARNAAVPRHVAIVMDGNGRWAKKRFMPRLVGHKAGMDTLVRVIDDCAERGIEHLTVYAFSSENWRRPEEEVSGLMNLVLLGMVKYLQRLADKGVRIKVVGERSSISERLRRAWDEAEQLTECNTRITLSVAFNYGAAGTWCKPASAPCGPAWRPRRSPKRCWPSIWPPPTRLTLTCSSAPVASCG